jgi:AcrR family transcriptional regulator
MPYAKLFKAFPERLLNFLTTIPSRRYSNVVNKMKTSSVTRIRILDAANRVIQKKGANALTLDAVARQAGVSKGGLLYHFPNKDSLIVGMVERLIAKFDSVIKAESSKQDSDWLTAYIRASFKADPERDRTSRALFAAIGNNPGLLGPLQKKFKEWQGKSEASAGSAETGTIIRLALDGMWICDLLGFAPPKPALRTKMLNVLLKLAMGDA